MAVDFALSEDQQLLVGELRRFGAERIRPGAVERERRHEIPADLLAEMGEMGLLGMLIDEQYGGGGADPLTYCLAVEEISAACPSIGVTMSVTNSVCGWPIDRFGSPDLKQRVLPSLASGAALGGFCLTEPGAGSDPGAMKTVARRDGDSWVIDGEKAWITNAGIGHWFVTLARTDPQAPKHAGLSYFLLDMRTPGITTRPIRQITQAEHFNEVFFDEVRIPAENMLGQPGEGWRLARMTLGYERSGLARRRRVEMESFLDLAGRCTVNGRAALADGAVRDEVATLWMRAEALRFLSYRGLTELARGEPPGPGASVAKIASADLINRIGKLAVRLLGDRAIAADDPAAVHWQRAMLDATARRIAGGSDEIQRDIIAERVLRLPREPKTSDSAGGRA